MFPKPIEDDPETLVIRQDDDGFRVYPPTEPAKSYYVSGTFEAPRCTCPDFERHKHDPTWRCKHILAVLNQTYTLPSEMDGAPRLPEESQPETNTKKGEPRMETMPEITLNTSRMLIKRSVSPDGKIDSLSVEFSIPLQDQEDNEVLESAQSLMELQSRIVGQFLLSNGKGNKPETEQPIIGQGENGTPIVAEMLSIGGMNGKWGRRLFITIQANSKTLRLYGNRKQLGEFIAKAGFPDIGDRVTEGLTLHLPCRVVTKPTEDGKYLNVEEVLPIQTPIASTGRAS